MEKIVERASGLSAGCHARVILKNPESEKDLIKEFFQQGLVNGEKCVYISSNKKKSLLDEIEFENAKSREEIRGITWSEIFKNCERCQPREKRGIEICKLWQDIIGKHKGLRIFSETDCKNSEPFPPHQFICHSQCFSNLSENLPLYTITLLTGLEEAFSYVNLVLEDHIVIYKYQDESGKPELIYPKNLFKDYGNGGSGNGNGNGNLENYYQTNILKTIFQNHRDKFVRDMSIKNSLTPQESRVFHYLLNFWPNEKIGKSLHISLHTVKQHLKNIYRKLGVHNKHDVIKSFYDKLV